MSDAGDFREALGSFVTGVTIVTASDGTGRDVGVTANSFNSVSLDPPMVLWSLARNSSSLAAFEAASHFAVHILAADQEELSNRFARSNSDKFAGLEVTRGAGGAPLLADAAARFQCRTAFQYDGGDHVIFVGEVEAFERSQRPPLAFHGGRYAPPFADPAGVTILELAAAATVIEDHAAGTLDAEELERLRDLLARVVTGAEAPAR